ncbi:pirin family protein [Thalassomonas sp. M1454]|uniref:pirin family protein n=1 Tax=Thalassomonas sp. M1454 TaxID=2594477 RepID=UPI00117E8158|nr:pirin-like bicupin family protein [Thalassomonas sp. M1454]TRX54486.1 pirin family protein [Thalassomonas sp. M1454]
MIKQYTFDKLGKANHGWLQSSHHFSFAYYYNVDRMGFGTLRVVNDDWVAPGTGFPTHPHKNMEIISFIRSGAITHKDSAGNEGITPAGEVQVMSAGTGIAHSEYNLTKDPLTFYQIWIEPNEYNIKPRWESKRFAEKSENGDLALLVSGYPEDQDKALYINQFARIYGGKVEQGSEFEIQVEHQAYVLASDGQFEVSDEQDSIVMNKGDGAEVTMQKTIKFKALTDSEIIVIDAPEK